MSTYYRREERDVRERDWDTRSTVSRRDDRREEDSGFVTKKVYRIPASSGIEEDRRTVIGGGSHRGSDRDREQAYTTETRVIRRAVEPEPEPEIERREIRITERSRERPREEPIRERIVYREREDDRLAPYRPIMREDELRDSRGELARYSRETDYYSPPPPQPIIIRQEPQQIIIQEAPRAPITVPEPRREEDFQMVQRSEVRESQKSTVGSEHRTERPRKDEEEDYYYERRVKRVDRDDDYDDRRSRREREVSPGSSVSQRDNHHRRRYSSEDSYDYVRKEEYGYDDEEPRHRRHLAEGAIAGIGAAEVLRHHREKESGEKGSRRGRVGKDLGAAALGVVGAEAVSRARSAYRSRSRRRSRDRDRDRDEDDDYRREGRRRRKGEKERSRSRSRSESHSRVKKLAGLGLGAAAVAAAAAYANKQRKAKNNERQSRSRHRQGSVDDTVTPDDARDPKHRNSKIAQAGLAGAAVAGLVERARSKSKGRDRSKSRIRQGIPIAAAGIGSAAIAGLYEKNQASKKEKEARREERAERRAHRERSRSVGYGPDGNREMAAPAQGEPGMIEYGDGQVYSGVPDYGRPASQQAYYGNHEDAMVPAAAAGGAAAYVAAQERARSLSGSDDEKSRRRRHRRRKSGSRSRSRNRDADGVALDATDHEQRKAARKEERRREKQRKREAEEASYGQQPHGYEQPYSPPPGAGYPPQGGYYPPPAGAPGYVEGAEHYGQPVADSAAQIHPDYGYQQPGGYAPPDPNAYPAPTGGNPYAAGPGGPRRADENVSQQTSTAPLSLDAAPLYKTDGAPFYYDPHTIPPFGDGLNTPRARSPSGSGPSTSTSGPPRSSSQPPPSKSVTFNLTNDYSDGQPPPSPEAIRNRRQHQRFHPDDDDDDDYEGKSSPPVSRSSKQRPGIKRQATGRVPQPQDLNRDRNAHEDDPESDSTEDLPDRFDKHGRRIDRGSDGDENEDPLQSKISELLGGGAGGAGIGVILKSFGLGGGEGSEGEDSGGESRRRRRRDGAREGEESGSGRRRRRRESR